MTYSPEPLRCFQCNGFIKEVFRGSNGILYSDDKGSLFPPGNVTHVEQLCDECEKKLVDPDVQEAVIDLTPEQAKALFPDVVDATEEK